jgi:hypothetical protein
LDDCFLQNFLEGVFFMKNIFGSKFSFFGDGEDTVLTGNPAPVAQNFDFIAPDLSPQRTGHFLDAGLISTTAQTSQADSGAGLNSSISFVMEDSHGHFLDTASLDSQITGPQGISAAAPAAPNFWINEGPSPGINGQETVAPNNQINGAIQAIAVHPTDPNIMYVGSVNGGIWKTTNATAASPHWVPLTDNLPSLSIGALEFDPTDATHQTLIAGIGSTSSYFLNDQFTGVLRSTDGGTTWSQLGTAAASLGGENITSVAARGTTLLAAADNGWGGGLGKGLFRSTDSGANWTSISDGAHGLPNLTDVSDIVGDPSNSNVFYAAATGASGGVFKSTDTGLTWTNITSGIGIFGSTTDKVELAVHHDATNTSVFATVDNGGVLSGVFRSLNDASFVALNVPSGGTQGFVHGAITADPTNFNIVYVGFGGGSANYLTRIDASQPSGSQITKIAGGSFGSPHVDTREMQIDASGNLILGTDGGLFRLPTPGANTGVWSAIVGDMSVFELHSIAYDHVSHIIMAGAQDNGTLFQLTPGNATWDHPGFGDGGDVVVDDVSLAGSSQSIRYFSSQNLGGWTRQVYDSANHLVSTTNLSVLLPEPSDDDDSGDSPIADPTFTTPVELNNVNPARLLVGGSAHIYESLNQGTTLTSIANVGVNGIGSAGGGVMVYGGFQGGVGNPDLIYAASGANVLKQTASGGGFTTTSPGGSTIRGVTDNPTNWATVFAIDDNQIFKSTNAGGTWVDVTANLTSISASDFRSIEYVHGTVDDALVVGTSSGVFYALASQLGGAASWSKFGGNVPDVIVYDLEYDAADNVLVAGTMGRGAWLVNNATTNLGLDSQPAGSVAINDMSITEGNSGSQVMTFTVTRSGGTGAFAVNFVTSDGSASTADNDYNGTSGTLNFGTGVNTQTISVTINGDTKFEGNETFSVNLSGATNGAAIGDGLGIGTITNDDAAFAPATFQLAAFAPDAGGWSSQDSYPRMVSDVSGDGLADIVGFGAGGVQVSLATGGGHFAAPTGELGNFGFNAGGWTSENQYPRLLADVNGDSRADIVAFGAGGVQVSLATGSGHFAAPTGELGNFGFNAGGWTSQDQYPRLLADVNGDSRADIVAFGAGGVQVSLATGGGHFAAPTGELGNFGFNAGGWTSQDQYPRLLGDVNGDHMADIVAFGAGGVQVSLATGGGHFAAPTGELGNFGFNAGGWTSENQYPRLLADVNGDGMADIVGFGSGGVQVALATGGGHFAAPTGELGSFGTNAGGWSSQDLYPRALGDVNGDTAADIIGFGQAGVYEALANSFHLV